jgi:hypothetical protein
LTCSYAKGGPEALRRRQRPGNQAAKALAAVAIARRLMAERRPTDPPLTRRRIQEAVKAETGETISDSWLAKALKKGASHIADRVIRSRDAKMQGWYLKRAVGSKA